MARGGELDGKNQLCKSLIIGDGKVGKTDWAARAVEAGLNVLMLDGDVAQQTVAGLTKDPLNPLTKAQVNQIFCLSVHDRITANGRGHEMTRNVADFFSSRGKFLWNDSKNRQYSRASDGDPTDDTIWEINPTKLDDSWVLLLDSWTSLTQSSMQWAADELKLDLGEILSDERGKMRDVYQMAGEKLTQYLVILRSMPCHVIVTAHPCEFTKLEKPTNVSVGQAKERDMVIKWTKMVPKSVTNNHSMTMAGYFTDLIWFGVDGMGRYKADYRASNDRISGSHMKIHEESRGAGSFKNLLEHLGGKARQEFTDYQNVIKIHEVYEAFAKKPALDVSNATPQIKGKALNFGLAKK